MPIFQGSFSGPEFTSLLEQDNLNKQLNFQRQSLASTRATEQERIAEEQRQFDTLFNQRQDLVNRVLGMIPGPNSSGRLSQPGGPDGQGGDLLGLLEGYGEGERARINQSIQNASGTALARLEQRGFGGSSALPGMLGALERERTLQLGELDDRVIDKKIGISENAANRQSQLLQSLLGTL